MESQGKLILLLLASLLFAIAGCKSDDLFVAGGGPGGGDKW